MGRDELLFPFFLRIHEKVLILLNGIKYASNGIKHLHKFAVYLKDLFFVQFFQQCF